MPIGATNRHAQRLRRDATDAEHILWRHLRNRRLAGLKFRRQATIGPYVADFLCAEKRLVVELDGGQHGPAADRHRTAELERLGYRVIRFWNDEVAGNPEGVLLAILREARAIVSRFEAKAPSSNCD